MPTAGRDPEDTRRHRRKLSQRVHGSGVEINGRKGPNRNMNVFDKYRHQTPEAVFGHRYIFTARTINNRTR